MRGISEENCLAHFPQKRAPRATNFAAFLIQIPRVAHTEMSEFALVGDREDRDSNR